MQNLSRIMNMLPLCLVTNSEHARRIPKYADFLRQSICGGVTMVQYRDKAEDKWKVRCRAIEIQEILRPLKIPFILNDHVELAAEIDAQGVHIGQSDMSIDEARKILGPHKIIGLSIENLADLQSINRLEGLYYVTASAVFPSKTKPNCTTIWELNGLKEVVYRSKHPVTAIGGITAHNAHDIVKVGAVGLAVIGAIHDSTDPQEAARHLRSIVDNEIMAKSR